MVEILDVQKAIVAKHLANDFSLLNKQSFGSTGYSGVLTHTFSGSYILQGLVNTDQYLFLPHFEFDVGTTYNIKIPQESMSGETIYYTTGCIKLKLKAKDDERLIDVAFLSLNDLFYLRNLAREGQLLSIPEVDEKDRSVMPIEESQISAYFYFRASSTTCNQLHAVMQINHPAAEEIIKQYLEAIDKRFDDYRGLEQYFQEKDDSGRILWEDQNLQSRRYNQERKKLHKALFDELTNVLTQGDIKYTMD